ncbi:MAG: hypothetical protein NTV34_15770, partial [Proteobacteria bacterium]|nr:hypothetical protein [Pseudomonadota bacterium]
ALVDEIIRVADISANEITRSPTIVAKVPPQYLRGIATVNQTITCIMDLKLVLTQEELKKVSHSMQVNTKNIAA